MFNYLSKYLKKYKRQNEYLLRGYKSATKDKEYSNSSVIFVLNILFLFQSNIFNEPNPFEWMIYKIKSFMK